MKNILLLSTFALFGFVGCQSEMPLAPSQATTLGGTWNYISTDGEDFSGYGITYSFIRDTWTYTLGDAGQKQYRFRVSGDSLTATLIADGMQSPDAIGSKVASRFVVHGDTLMMQTDGHAAILTRQ